MIWTKMSTNVLFFFAVPRRDPHPVEWTKNLLQKARALPAWVRLYHTENLPTFILRVIKKNKNKSSLLLFNPVCILSTPQHSLVIQPFMCLFAFALTCQVKLSIYCVFLPKVLHISGYLFSGYLCYACGCHDTYLLLIWLNMAAAILWTLLSNSSQKDRHTRSIISFKCIIYNL